MFLTKFAPNSTIRSYSSHLHFLIMMLNWHQINFKLAPLQKIDANKGAGTKIHKCLVGIEISKIKITFINNVFNIKILELGRHCQNNTI